MWIALRSMQGVGSEKRGPISRQNCQMEGDLWIALRSMQGVGSEKRGPISCRILKMPRRLPRLISAVKFCNAQSHDILSTEGSLCQVIELVGRL